MSNKTISNKPKRGTIGADIDRLVKKYGQSTTGIYKLQQALIECLDAGSTVLFQEKDCVGTATLLCHEMPRYKALQAEEAAILERVQQSLKKDVA